MEILSSLLEKEVVASKITLIHKCKNINLSHLIFADDLMIFSKADVQSCATINEILEHFSEISGLHVNRDEST